MFQSLVERGISLPVAAEPYRVLDESQGMGDLHNSVTIFWTGISGNPTCSAINTLMQACITGRSHELVP